MNNQSSKKIGSNITRGRSSGKKSKKYQSAIVRLSEESTFSKKQSSEDDRYFEKLDCDDPIDMSKLSLINFHFGKLTSNRQKKHFFKTRVYLYFLLQTLFFCGIWYFDNRIHRFSHVFLWQFAFISLILIPIIMSGLYRLKKSVGVNTVLTILLNFLFTPYFVYITRTIGESLYFQITLNYTITITILLILCGLLSKSLKYYMLVMLTFLSLIIQNVVLFFVFQQFSNISTLISFLYNLCILLYITYQVEHLKYVYNYTEGLTCFVDINIFIFWTMLGKLECILFTFIVLAGFSVWIFIK